MEEGKKLAAAYAPFATFLTVLDHLAVIGVPNQIDRSVFSNFSGMAQSQIFSALKFLELIDDKGIPQPPLPDLVTQKDKRKEIMREIIKKKYANLIALDLSKTTPSQFDNAFSSEVYAVGGDTRSKAKTFFIKAAQFAEIPISKLLIQKTRVTASKKKNATKERNGDLTEDKNQKTKDTLPKVERQNGEAVKTVSLQDGGRITLSADVNLLTLRGEDREFVFNLIDMLNDYEENQQIEENEEIAE